MNLFSKKEITIKSRQEEAICPSCGEWKTTDFTPEELQEREWECLDCATKRMTSPEDLPENRGQKEISKYSPEFEFLKRLVNLIVKEGIPPEEIKALSLSSPFRTIDDIDDLTAKIWTLATEKYHIPRQWLIKKLPEKKGSLKQAASTLELLGYRIYVNPTELQVRSLIKKTKDNAIRGLIDPLTGDLYVWDAFNLEHSQVSNYLGVEVELEDETTFGVTDRSENDYIWVATDPESIHWMFEAQQKIKSGKSKKAALWPAQEAAEDSTQPPSGYYAYQYGQDRDISVSGPRPDDVAKKSSPETDHALAMSIGEDVIKEYFFEKGIRWSQVVQFLKDQVPQLTDEDIANLKIDTKYRLEQYRIQVESKKKKGLSLADALKILESKGPKPVHVDYTDLTVELENGEKLSFDSATQRAIELGKISSKLQCPKCKSINVGVCNA